MHRTLASHLAFPASPLHGEGPWWAAREQELVWVDMVGPSVHLVDLITGSERSYPTPEYTGVAVGRERGGLIVMMGSGIAELETGSGVIDWILRVPGTGGDVKFNDGKCDPRGRFVCGTKSAVPEVTPGSLYVLDPDLSLRKAFTGMSLSNGLAWSQDGGTLYAVDSGPRLIRVFTYDLDSGTVGAERVPIEMPAEVTGIPDGMAIDADGCLWVAMHRGGTVRRFTPEGRLDATVSLPVTGATACAFGGPGLEDLYITTSPYVLGPQERAAQPHAGSIFACRPGVKGLPEPYFAG
jgi:sugar lactone lactonase YvrE